MILYYGFALFLGALFIVAPILNGQNALYFGTIKTSFYNYLSATATAFLFLLFLSNLDYFKQLPSMPIYYYIGGVFGCAIILLLNYFTTRIKAFYIVILPFIGQMTMGLALDYMILGNFEFKKIMGIIIICLGLYLQKEKKEVNLITSENESII